MTAPSLDNFLLARIAEDEAAARDAGSAPWVTMETTPWVQVDTAAIREAKWKFGNQGHVASAESQFHSAHIARHDPARVLAECEAKRGIVQMWKKADYDPFRSELPSGRAKARALEVVLMHLALPYADHPDYQQEWRP